MKKKFKDNDLEQFYQQFKAMPDYYGLDQVHQLINNPSAKATQTNKTNFNYLNITIMTITIVGLGLLLYWWAPIESNQTSLNTNNKIINSEETLPAPPEEKKLKVEPESNVEKLGKEVQNENIAASKNNPVNLWPEDSVIDGNSLIVTLTNEELEKIGFMLDDTGIYYKNTWQGDTVYFHSKFENRVWRLTPVTTKKFNDNKKELFSKFDFYPVRLTHSLLDEIDTGQFSFENDLLIPVRLLSYQTKYKDAALIIWIKPSDDLFQLLPEKLNKHELIFREIKNQRKNLRKKNFVVYPSNSLLDNGNFSLLELKKKELADIGFIVDKFSIKLQTKGWEIHFKPKSYGVSTIKNQVEYHESLNLNIVLVFLSNLKGFQNIKWKLNDEPDKWENQYFEQKIQHLVPVLLKKSDYPSILPEDQIFWFEPSEALFAALPTDIGSQLREEYEIIKSDSEELKSGSSCTFFEACKSTLHMRRLSIYPNPADGHTSLEFDLAEPIRGRVALVDISGNVVKELILERDFKSGRNSFSLELSDVQEGIYLLTIYSDHGFKTYRLMVSR